MGTRAVVEEEVDDIVISAVGVADICAAGARGRSGAVASEARCVAVGANGVGVGRAHRRLEGIATADSASEARAAAEEGAAIARGALVLIGSGARGAARIARSTHGVAGGRANGDGELTGGASGTRLARANSVEEKSSGAASAHGAAGA